MEDTSAIMERIKLIASDLGMSGREFSSSIGQSNSYLATEPKKGIRSDVLTKIIINYPQYNINWVLTGNGSMYVNEPTTSSEIEKELIGKLEDAKEEVGYYKGLLAAHGIPVEPWKKERSA